ncbi:YHS domain-containing (seleno)protein [uncultured Paracoccus sp.]|uniref:YHS domain-containing (seleno)protein n=1 Tax=uncultured Paracoccus sp. TaxID=189685 RepID=UPI0025FAB4E5|nr:YHS domain-containing (seleno)protein [uncultured Paracoccus sp.]
MIRNRFAYIFGLLLLAPAAWAQDWALEGIDPVAYTVQGQAVAGRSDIATRWGGKSWHFATEENRATFESNPRAYAPGLNGLCVVALSEGRAEPGNPRHFVVIGQRTYLVRSENARQRLQQDPRKVLMEAKAIWTRMNP